MSFRANFPELSPTTRNHWSLLVLCLSLLMGWGGTELLAEQDPDLAWKKPVGAQLFEEARTAYDAKEYAEAVKKFKDARKQAKNRATRMHIDNWMLATEGANELNALIQQAKGGKESAAYRIGAKNYPRFAQSPIGPEYKKFLTEMETKLFVVLEIGRASCRERVCLAV